MHIIGIIILVIVVIAILGAFASEIQKGNDLKEKELEELRKWKDEWERQQRLK
jgi:hypothetical protein